MRRAATQLTRLSLLSLLVLTAPVHAKRMPPPPTVASARLDAKALPAGIKAKGKRVVAPTKPATLSSDPALAALTLVCSTILASDAAVTSR